MIPLFPFIAGLALGAAAVSALRGQRTRKALAALGAHPRDAGAPATEAAAPVAAKPRAARRTPGPRKTKATRTPKKTSA